MQLHASAAPAEMGVLPQAPHPSLLRTVPWRWRDVLIGVAPLVLARAVPELIDPAAVAGAPRWLWLPFTLLLMAWMLAYPWAIARRRQAGFPQLPRLRSVVVEALFALLAVPVVLVVLTGIIGILFYLLGAPALPTNPLESIARSPNRFEFVALMILAVSVGPVAEEMFFRGLLYNALRQRLHLVVAAPLQAIVFGFMHPFGLIGSSVVAFLGLAFALLYERRRTLLAPILLHSLWNAMAVAVMAWGIASAPQLGVGGESHKGGVVVTQVLPGSAADKAGLRIGDVVTAVDGELVTDMTELARFVRARQIGDGVDVEFIRNGRAHQVEAVLLRWRR